MASTVEAPGATYPAEDLELDLDFDFDFDHLLQSFCGEDLLLHPSADIWIPDPSLPPPSTTEEEEKYDSPSAESNGSSNSISPYVTDLEKFLMEEEEEEKEGEGDIAAKEGFDAVNFFAGLFAGGSRNGEGEVVTPDSVAAADSERKEKEEEATDAGGQVATPNSEDAVESERKEEEEEEATVAGGGEDDDPVSKKLRRQMRNRDSAMKSRERKKMYVKELEMKSKYLEAECRRLDYALRCCAAENMALRQHLPKERLFDASAAKQESAVLFVESLLLGSLSWLVSIICLLFLVPVLPNMNPKDVNHLAKGLGHEFVAAERVTNKILETNLGLGLVIFGKRCRGTRTRTKSCFVPSARCYAEQPYLILALG